MLTKVFQYYRSLSTVDFCRKIIFYFITIGKRNILKSLRAGYYFKNRRVILGKNVRISGLPYNIAVGENTEFYDNCVFEFGDKCRTSIGKHVTFSYGVVFCCRHEITIGNDVQVGEYTSIRDSTHDYTIRHRPMKYAEDLSSPVKIGSDVWIGRGCIILPGSVIEDGVVVGANSVVKGTLRHNGIYAGSPAVFLKSRT